MAKKNRPEKIPSWIKDLYKEDLDRVVRGERPMYFRGMNDGPLKNVSPEFDVLSGGAAVKGMNGIRGTLSPLNNGMGNYNFSIRGINKKIGELVDEAGLYLPEKLRPVYRTVVDAMSSSKDKGLGHITQPLANALYPADERRDRRLDGEHPVGYVDAIDGIWPREKYGLWGEKIENKQEGGLIEDITRKMYRSDLDRIISGQSPQYYGHLKDKPLENEYPEFNMPLPKFFRAGKTVYKNMGLSDDTMSKIEDVIDKAFEISGMPNKFVEQGLERVYKALPENQKKPFKRVIRTFNHQADNGISFFGDELSHYALGDDKERKFDGGYIASRDNTSVGGQGVNLNTRYDIRPYEDPITPIISGFIPGLDVASDIFDMATAVEDDDKVGIVLASLGFLPIIGEVASYANKARKFDDAARAIRISEKPKDPVYYKNELPGNITYGDIVDNDIDKGSIKFMSNIFFERGFYPRFENMINDMGKNLRHPYKSGMLIDEDKAFIKKMKGKDGNIVIPDKGTPLRDELNRMLFDKGIMDQEGAWNRWINYAKSKDIYDNRSEVLNGVKYMIENPKTYDIDMVDGVSVNGHVVKGLDMRDGNRTFVDSNLPYNEKLSTTIHEIRHKIGRYVDDTFEGKFKHGLTMDVAKSMDSSYKTLNYDDFLDNANYMWEKSATNTQLQFLLEKLRGQNSSMDDIGSMYSNKKLMDIMDNVSNDDIRSLLREINSDYSDKYIKALDKGEMSYDDIRKALAYPIISGLMYKAYDKASSDNAENDNHMKSGGNVGGDRMVIYDTIWDYLTDDKGIPQTQAVGILANIAAESGGDTEALGTAGDFGIQQWLGPRKKELQRRYGKKPTLTQQLDYLVDEYQGRVPGLGWNYINQGKFFDKDAQGNVYNYYMYSKADFDNATNYKDATVAWNQGYGRPLGSTLRNEKRFEFADMFSNRYGVPENEPMRYEFGQRDSGTGDGGQQPVPETVAPADPSLASRPSMDSWWEKEGQDLLYKMLAQSGANKKAIEDIANNIKNDPQSEAQIAEVERMRKEQAKRQLMINMIPGLMLNIKGMSRSQN